MLHVLAMRRRALGCAILLGCLVPCCPSIAQPSGELARGPNGFPALPSWPDEAAVSNNTLQAGGPVASTNQTPREFEVPVAATAIHDSTVQPTRHTADTDRRRLGPPMDDSWNLAANREPSTRASGLLPKFGLPLESIYTTGTALAIVVGLFLLCVWALRRSGGRKATTLLPEDAVCVLGRVPLAARQFAQLIHCGNKLVLLSVTPDGAETLTEITDPVEVDRMLGLCMQGKTSSSSAEFDEVFRKLATEAAPADFTDRSTAQLSTRMASDAYAAYRENANRA